VRGLRERGPRFCFPSRRSRRIQETKQAPRGPRINRQIRISPVRVIGSDGAQLGVLEVDVALSMAVEAGLDLVEVAPMARPPVVRIMDYGKYKFEMAKQARLAKKKQHVIQLKEVKFRPGIEKHDFDTKVNHARAFIAVGRSRIRSWVWRSSSASPRPSRMSRRSRPRRSSRGRPSR